MQLSTTPKVRLRMPVGGAGGGPLEVVITQQDLERLSAPLFRRARLPIDQACWQARSITSACRRLRFATLMPLTGNDCVVTDPLSESLTALDSACCLA